ncbi:MAG: ester cyclase [archaeon]|nr:ester cyclase [archaeon]
MSLEKNKAVVRRWIEAENKKDLAVLNELMAADYFDPSLQVRGREASKAKAKQLMAMVFKGFPYTHETIEDIISEGDKVWVHLKITGTHTGEYRGLAPTGKKITYTAIVIWRIVNGKVIESWGIYDPLDAYKQLGVIEYKGFPDEVK